MRNTCRRLGATYARGWLIMVGASRTSPVPGSGMRCRHERWRTLPRFGALLGDNTPSPALMGLLMITKTLVSTMVLLELYARGRRKQGWLSPLSMCESSSNRLGTLCMGDQGGLYRPTSQGYNGNLTGCSTRLSVTLVAGFSAGCWGPPPGWPRRLVWYGADMPLPPLVGLAGCWLL